MKKKIYFLSILVLVVLYTFKILDFVCANGIKAEDSGFNELTKIIYFDWELKIKDILNYFPGGIYKKTDEEDRIIGYYILPIKLFDRDSKIIFYDFESKRRWGNIPMRKIYIKIADKDDGGELLKEIVNYIYDNYAKYLILHSSNINIEEKQYALQIYNLFGTERGLDIRFSQIESYTGSKWLNIMLVPQIHKKGLSEEEIRDMLENSDYQSYKL